MPGQVNRITFQHSENRNFLIITWFIMAFKSSLFCPLQFKTLLVMLTTLHAASAEYYCDAHYLAGTAADAQPVLQACIDSTPSGDTLSIPPGVYSFESGLTISQAISVSSSLVSSMRCADDPTACATFQASPSFYSATGLLHIVGGVANVAIDHLIIDGNREMRLDSQSASEVRCLLCTHQYYI